MALDGLRLGAEPGNTNQREAEHLGLDRLDRRGPGWAGFASQPGFGRGLLRRGESRGSVGPQQLGCGFDICQRRGCACDTSRLSNRASPRRDYRCCDCDGNSLFGLVRWGIGPRRRIPGSVAVPELAGCCRAILPSVRPEDLANSKKELSNQIAHNSGELAELRRRGEREYFEFDMNKSKEFAHISDVLVQLRKTDVKKQKFDVVIQADDMSVTKKDRTANEPVTFLVGPDRLRYELVVNFVDKDRIRGYLSTPKDKTLSAEGPSGRRLQ